MVEVAQEFNRFEILAPAELIGDPFPLLARVIQIKHRSHGVHPQAVNVKALAPKQRVGRQKIADFVAAVIEDERAPILVRALPRVFMLV